MNGELFFIGSVILGVSWLYGCFIMARAFKNVSAMNIGGGASITNVKGKNIYTNGKLAIIDDEVAHEG